MNTAGARKKCGKELLKIAPYIEAEDRKQAMTEFSVSYVTISRYLTGKVANLIFGINLLNFFKRRIQQRAVALSELTS
jgi:hypothetical protein